MLEILKQSSTYTCLLCDNTIGNSAVLSKMIFAMVQVLQFKTRDTVNSTNIDRCNAEVFLLIAFKKATGAPFKIYDATVT